MTRSEMTEHLFLVPI